MSRTEAAPVPGYRPDIDGLRALAVLAVMLFHADVPYFSGGYLGVDVFFVISGFLITRLLVAPGGDALGQFYLRRCRRILPALLVMLVVVAAVATWLLLPDHLRTFGGFLSHAAVLLPNVAAWRYTDYFTPAFGIAPLLHLWSIGVEEQFYLAYPLVLIGLTRWLPRWRAAAIGCLALLSLALWIWGAEHHARASFFLGPTRAWELLAGATLALTARSIASHALREWLAVAAMGVVLAGFCVASGEVSSTGWSPVPVVLATAALIATGDGEPTRVARALAWRPLVFVGLISYSLYLWHLPLLAFARYYLIVPLTEVQTAGILAATFVIATASWRWIETPVRRGQWPRSSARFLALVATVSVACLAFGMVLQRTEGLPSRMPPSVRMLVQQSDGPAREWYRCFALETEKIANGEVCHLDPVDPTAPKVLLWGDSHSLQVLTRLQEFRRSRPFDLYYAATSLCRPLTGVHPAQLTKAAAARCDAYNEAMAAAVAKIDPDLVVFAPYWSFDASAPMPDAEFSRGLQATLARIGAPDRAVCAVLDHPVFDINVTYALAMAQRRGIATDFMELPVSRALEATAASDTALRALQARGLLRVVDPKQLLCPDAYCRFRNEEGQALYYDRDHLSAAGGQWVEGEWLKCLSGLPANPP